MDKLSRLTNNVLISKNLNKAASAALICHEAGKALKEFFDKEFLREINVVSYRDGSLYLSTTSSGYAQEIILKEKDIIGEVNKALPGGPVKKIRFKAETNSQYARIHS